MRVSLWSQKAASSARGDAASARANSWAREPRPTIAWRRTAITSLVSGARSGAGPGQGEFGEEREPFGRGVDVAVDTRHDEVPFGSGVHGPGPFAGEGQRFRRVAHGL